MNKKSMALLHFFVVLKLFTVGFGAGEQGFIFDKNLLSTAVES